MSHHRPLLSLVSMARPAPLRRQKPRLLGILAASFLFGLTLMGAAALPHSTRAQGAADDGWDTPAEDVADAAEEAKPKGVACPIPYPPTVELEGGESPNQDNSYRDEVIEDTQYNPYIDYPKVAGAKPTQDMPRKSTARFAPVKELPRGNYVDVQDPRGIYRGVSDTLAENAVKAQDNVSIIKNPVLGCKDLALSGVVQNPLQLLASDVRKQYNACANAILINRYNPRKYANFFDRSATTSPNINEDFCQNLRLTPLPFGTGEDDSSYFDYRVSDYIAKAAKRAGIPIAGFEGWLSMESNGQRPDYPVFIGELADAEYNRGPAEGGEGATSIPPRYGTYERIIDPTHPFSPRYDFKGNDRGFYSIRTAIYGYGGTEPPSDDPKKAVPEYGDNLIPYSPKSSASCAVACAAVPVDILDFRAKRFDSCMGGRINRNIEVAKAADGVAPIGANYGYVPKLLALRKVISTIFDRFSPLAATPLPMTPQVADNMRSTLGITVPFGRCINGPIKGVCSTRFDGEDQGIGDDVCIVPYPEDLCPPPPAAPVPFWIPYPIVVWHTCYMTFSNCPWVVPFVPSGVTKSVESCCESVAKPVAGMNLLKIRTNDASDVREVVSAAGKPPVRKPLNFPEGVPEGYSFYEYFGNHRPYMRWWDTGGEAGQYSNTPVDYYGTLGSLDAIVGVGREGNYLKENPLEAIGQACRMGGDGRSTEERGLMRDLTQPGLSNSTAVPPATLVNSNPALSLLLRRNVSKTDGNTSWTELKLYQVNTLQKTNGLNCIGRYERVFKDQATADLVLARAGAAYGRDLRQNIEGASTPQTTNGIDMAEIGWSLSWRGYVSSPDLSYRFPFFGTSTPGKGIRYMRLDQVQAGDVIIWDDPIVSAPSAPGPAGSLTSKRRLPHMSYVVEGVSKDVAGQVGDIISGKIPDKLKQPAFVRVIDKNVGKVPDACGNTDALGIALERRLYPPIGAGGVAGAAATGVVSGAVSGITGGRTSLTGNPAVDKKHAERGVLDNTCRGDTWLEDCVETEWNKVKVYRASEDMRIPGTVAGGTP